MVLARRGARWKAVGRNRIARSWQDSIGRVTADWETGTDDAGNSKLAEKKLAASLSWLKTTGF